MNITTLHIKGMVCPRCIMAVEGVLSKLKIDYINVILGEIHLVNPLDEEQEKKLEAELVTLGFEILSSRKSQLIEKIKNAVIQMVHHQNNPEKIGRLSDQLPIIIGQSYSSLSTLFSELEGQTIEKYLILQKIEKVKELLIYEELNISEIAYKLNYSSSQHLSRQFKDITGMTPSSFKKAKHVSRRSLNDF